MATTTTEAEEKVQGLLDQRDLYVTTSRHTRRLLACVKDLWRQTSLKHPNLAWLSFRKWVLENQTAAVEQANVFICGYLEKNRHRPSCSHTVRLYLQAFRTWSIEVSRRLRDQIAQFEREEWRPAQLTRRNEQQVKKLRQFESLDRLWPLMVDYFLEIDAAQFRTLLKRISSNRVPHTGIASSSFIEMEVISRKSNAAIKGILACTLAFASLLRTTGMRGLTAMSLTMRDFTELEDNSVLLERWEKKLGSTRNVSKPVYVRVVPGKLPKLDCLIHLAKHLKACLIGTAMSRAPKACNTSGDTCKGVRL